MTATGLGCASCGTELPPDSRFCNKCGAPITQVSRSAEYKQVTVLFADVVHSMDIASAVGTERLREIMADARRPRFGGSAALWRHGRQIHRRRDHGGVRSTGGVGGPRYPRLSGGTGYPRGDEAACHRRPGPRRCGPSAAVGLNSGQVIAGEIGSRSLGYTTIGEQVGMAQRMESVAPPGGVMLSASTARLVEGAATLGESELVQIKGADAAVTRPSAAGHGRRASHWRAC